MAEAPSQSVIEDIGPHQPVDPDLFESEMNPHLDALYRNALRLVGNPK